MSTMVDNITDVFKSVAQTSTVKNAKIVHVVKNQGNGSQDVAVEVMWSSCNLASLDRTLNCGNYLIQEEKVVSFQPVPTSKNMLLRQTSGSGRLTACVMTSEKDKEAEHFIIVDKSGSMATVDLKVADKHGKVYADQEFSCLEWSPDETEIAYIAEKRRIKPANFFTPPKSGGEDGRGQEFIYRDDWGEQLKGKHQSVVCFLNVKTKEIRCHELPDQMCPGQLVWAPGGAGVIGVAFVSQPYRLGLVYCRNRESRLFHMDMEGNFSFITEGSSSITFPRVSPDGASIAFLRTTAGGPHAQCSQLCLLSWPSKQERVIIDVVQRQKLIEEGHKFMGIYSAYGLPRRCWLSDSQRIVFSTVKLSNIVPYVVNVETGSILELPHSGSHQVLDTYEDWILVNFSSVVHPYQVLLGQVPGQGQEKKLKLKEVTAPSEIPGVKNNYQSHWMFVNETPHPDPKYSDIPISVLYYGPTTCQEGAPKRPLICWPHGGPHSAICNVFSMAAAFFVRLGYSVVFPNYRGSLGSGKDGVDSLPGHCGLVDVSDVHEATLACLKRFPDVLDASQVLLFGGSHGGFLVTHLAAQYPDFYKAVAARNPVTDISAMANVTDIQDWTFVESGQSYKHGQVPNGATLTKMLEMSPISHIDNLKAPVLLLLGNNDARVPVSQGLNFHKMLRARGVETELLMYDDCHPLNKVDVEADSLINTAIWFQKHITSA